MNSLALVVPCFNEEDAIAATVSQICSLFNTSKDLSYELIFVNDGSSDATGKMLDELAKQNPIRVLHHQQNRGYGAALKTGISNTACTHIAITDADGTYPNERLLELFFHCISKDYDMVVGARIGKDVTYSKVRKLPKYFLNKWINQVAGCNVPDFNSGMRVFKREKAIKYLGVLPNTFSFTTTITLSMHTNWERVDYVPISYKMRIGNSKIRPVRDTIRFSMLIARTGMYFAPARLLFPPLLIVGILFLAALVNDVINMNLTDKTIILFGSLSNLATLALIADMINKRGIK